MRIRFSHLCSIALVALGLSFDCSASAKPSKQDLDTFYKLQNKMTPDALSFIDNKIKAGKDLGDWNELKAIWYFRGPGSHFEEMFFAARSAARQDPKNTHILVTYAMSLTMMKKHEAAQEFLDRVIKSNRKEARALAVEAYLLADQNRSEDLAREEMKSAIKIAPNDPDVNNLALMFYRKIFDYDSAKQSLDRWIKASPNDLLPRMILAELLKNARHRDEAIAECKKVLAINPDLDWAHHVLINTCADKMDYKAVIASVSDLLTKSKSAKFNYELWVRRAEAYGHLNQYDKAISDYTSAMNVLAPGTPQDKLPVDISKFHEKAKRCYLQYFTSRAQMYVKTGKSLIASQQMSQILSMSPHNAGALLTRIEAYEALKKYDLALADMDRLLRKDSDVAEWYKIKIRLLRKMGREADAKAVERKMKEVYEFGTR